MLVKSQFRELDLKNCKEKFQPKKFKVHMSPSNFCKSGSRLEICPQGEFQNSVTKVESKLDIDNPKLCSHEAQIMAQFEVTQIPPCIHKY